MEIIAINPRPRDRKGRWKKSRKRTTAKKRRPQPKKGKPMAAKKKKRSAPKPKTIIRYRAKPKKKRKNPSRARAYAKQTFLGVDIPGAAKDAIPMIFGALSGKFCAKKFAKGGSELDIWEWPNYLWFLGGSFGAALLTSAIFRGSRSVAKKVFTGGLVACGYKWVTRELTQHSATMQEYFGQVDPDSFDPYGYLGMGDIYEAGAEDYTGYYGQYQDRLPPGAVSGYGQILEPATVQMGQILEPATSQMGGYGDVTKEFEQAYGNAAGF